MALGTSQGERTQSEAVAAAGAVADDVSATWLQQQPLQDSNLLGRGLNTPHVTAQCCIFLA
jgi:hypothetical protein